VKTSVKIPQTAVPIISRTLIEKDIQLSIGGQLLSLTAFDIHAKTPLDLTYPDATVVASDFIATSSVGEETNVPDPTPFNVDTMQNFAAEVATNVGISVGAIVVFTGMCVCLVSAYMERSRRRNRVEFDDIGVYGGNQLHETRVSA
jgi:hypothetical protein